MRNSVDREKSIGGRDSPFYGAIFMANRSTKKECLERQLFGLPPPQVSFVKNVKRGMVLFLFEYEERKLYGVFQAISDGAVNISPRAFGSSGKQFPAQIRFKPIWNCKPLSEHDFRDAIRGNYYTANKFNLGLSKYQVSKLLRLFDSRRIKIQKIDSTVPNRKFIDRPVNSDYCRVGKVVAGGSDKNITKRKSLGDHMLSSFENVNSPCSESSADGCSPFSKRKVASFNPEDQDHMPPPMKRVRPDSLDISYLGDFIPLDPIESSLMRQQSLSSGYVPSSRQVSFVREQLTPSLSPCKHPPYEPDHPSLRQVILVRENLSPSLSPCKHPPYEPDHPSLRQVILVRENLSPSLSLSKHPPYVPDHHYPANLRPEGSPYLDLQPSATTTFSHKPSEERDENGALTAMHSDIEGKRISVFERLKEKKEPYSARLKVIKVETAPNNDELLDDNGTLVNEFMDVLETYRKDWTNSTKESLRKVEVKDVDDAKSGITSFESEDASEEEDCDDVVFEEMPVKFNRRNRTPKMESEINKGNDVSSRMPFMRRKLKRPSFVNGVAHDKEVIRESLVSTSEYEASQTSGLVGVSPIIHDGNNKTENFKDKGGESGENNINEFVQISLKYNGCSSEIMAGSQDFMVKVKGFIQELSEDIH
ncbi:hypothetical protein ACHQM5_004132 [Ranunculus cassubicifolius]